MPILNVKNVLVEEHPDFMTLVKVGAIQRKIDGVEGEMKYVPWIVFTTFRVVVNQATSEGEPMGVWPNTTGSYDTEGEAIQAGWGFIRTITTEKAIFKMIWDEWATE